MTRVESVAIALPGFFDYLRIYQPLHLFPATTITLQRSAAQSLDRTDLDRDRDLGSGPMRDSSSDGDTEYKVEYGVRQTGLGGMVPRGLGLRSGACMVMRKVSILRQEREEEAARCRAKSKKEAKSQRREEALRQGRR